MIGVFGKHPAFGDFISDGLSKPVQIALEEWLSAVLPRVREATGETWSGLYDVALPLRFWIGEEMIRNSDNAVAGVMVFSRDQVGRRFPLVALTEHVPAPPTIDPGQLWYQELESLMGEHKTPETAKDLSQSLTPKVDITPSASGDVSFWAVKDGSVDALLRDVSETDQRRAASRRSYFWSGGDALRMSTFYAMDTWPSTAQLQWLLTGTPKESMAEVAESD